MTTEDFPSRSMLPIRAVQGLLTIIILGLMAYVVDSWGGHWSSWSPSEANFLLFCSVWTILALIYLILTPTRYPVAAHKFGILAAEALTMIFWFAGFIALATLLGDIGCSRHWGVCKAATAAVVFAAFEWLLFSATTIMAALHVWRTRGTSTTKADPAVQVHPYPYA